MKLDLQALLNQLIPLCREAGEAILKVYEQDFDVFKKKDQSPLTAADLAAHHVILNGLQTLDVALPVLSEESGNVPWSERRKWRRYWLVDPLDGTKEFIKKNDEFTVNIALIDQNKAVLGIVYVPVSGIWYAGIPGMGAWTDRGRGLEELRVAPVEEPVRVAGSRSHSNERTQTFLECLGLHSLHPLGSSLKFCLIAEGKIDLYPRMGLTSEWDTAAAQAVVEGAGGQVCDLKGQPIRYNTKENILNPEFLVFAGDKDRWLKCIKEEQK